MNDQQEQTKPAGGESELAVGLEVDLFSTAERIIKAGKAGVGVRLSAKETRALLFYNLPCTVDDPRDVAVSNDQNQGPR